MSKAPGKPTGPKLNRMGGGIPDKKVPNVKPGPVLPGGKRNKGK